MKYTNLCLHMCVTERQGQSAHSKNLQIRGIVLSCQVSSQSSWLARPLETTQVNLENRKSKKINSHTEIADISVNSQGSELALEMAEDWKMLSEQCCLCRAQAHCQGTGDIQKTVWPSFTLRYFGPCLPEHDLKSSNLVYNAKVKIFQENKARSDNSVPVFKWGIMLHHIH